MVDGVEYLTQSLAQLAAHQQKIGEFIGQLHQRMSERELPTTIGSIEQQQKLLQRLGEWERYAKGIPGKISDDVLAYYVEGAPGRVITGRDLGDNTPVGLVPHPVPLDPTSAFYVLTLAAQTTEEAIDSARLKYNAKDIEELDGFEKELNKAVGDALVGGEGRPPGAGETGSGRSSYPSIIFGDMGDNNQIYFGLPDATPPSGRTRLPVSGEFPLNEVDRIIVERERETYQRGG